MYLGIEIGGTKLQAGLGDGSGRLAELERTTARASAGAPGILEQVEHLTGRLLQRTGLSLDRLQGLGIGFGGPVDSTSGRVAKSHQVVGWDRFPLADWCAERFGHRCVLQNDADTAGLAEAVLGAGAGHSPVFYMTIGSGIGGGLIVERSIYRGAGGGASEVGHLQVPHAAGTANHAGPTLESVCSGWGIAERIQPLVKHALEQDGSESQDASELVELAGGKLEEITAVTIATAARSGNQLARGHLQNSWQTLAWTLNQVIRLLCPQRIVIGGGVSQLGEELLFAPLRREVERHMFPPFRGYCEIVPADLGEEVVVHGALLLAAGTK